MTRQPHTSGPVLHRAEDDPPFRVPVRHRAFLAGSAHGSFPAHVPDAAGMIPVYAAGHARPAPTASAGAVRALLDEALPASGGVLLRGLPLTGRADFASFVTSLGYGGVGYRGGIAVRRHDQGAALNASEEDPRITLSPHNEMAYLPAYPRRIFFFCAEQAAEGGEVPVNDIRETAGLLPESVRARFRDRGVRYHRSLARDSSVGAVGWAETFGTDDRRLVERHLDASGLDYTYEWGADGHLRYHYRRDAFVEHPETGEELWFNQVTELHCSYWRAHPDFPAGLPDDAYPATTTYGDGTPFDEEEIAFLRGLLWRTTRAVRMRRGDVLVLDNQVLQHGRFAYTGSRRHYVSLTR